MPNLTWQVTKITEQPVLNSAGKVDKMLAVQFTVGAHGPFTELISRQDFMAGMLNAKLQAFAATVAALPQASS